MWFDQTGSRNLLHYNIYPNIENENCRWRKWQKQNLPFKYTWKWTFWWQLGFLWWNFLMTTNMFFRIFISVIAVFKVDEVFSLPQSYLTTASRGPVNSWRNTDEGRSNHKIPKIKTTDVSSPYLWWLQINFFG